MISSTGVVTSPAGADLNRTTSRRRGLSYLRALSHNRSSGGSSSTEPSRSPRHYFQRSSSCNENRPDPSTTSSRRRSSHSRPNEPTSPLASDGRPNPPSDRNTRSSSPPPPTDSGAGASEQHNTDEMARHRTSTLQRNTRSNLQGESAEAEPTSTPANPRTNSKTPSTSGTREEKADGESKHQLPTIRFFPHQELRNGRPSLTFAPISRTLPSEHSIIRVGRYSEREGVPHANPSTPSDAPVGFKSKVVSRKHCEFSFLDGQWQIKDVASSSGTFLNHIRLSQPNTESRLFPIKDGDIVQLGIDFRGGEEMIFRCVKIRIECNRAWQKKPNNFNKSRHQQLQSLAKDQPSADANSGECSICLGSVLPCQALFVAPCAHVWHYKCIRPLLEGKNSTYPQFQCPNCRAYSDLTADVDIAQSDIDEWMENTDDQENQTTHPNVDTSNQTNSTADAETNGQVTGEPAIVDSDAANDTEAERTTVTTDPIPEHPPVTISNPIEASSDDSPSLTPLRTSGLLARRQAANPASPELRTMNGNLGIPDQPDEDGMHAHLEHQRTRTQTPDAEQVIAGEGPLTPRNNAGPFVFDGSAGRSGARQLVVPGIPEITEENGSGTV
ncbi:uncharacterized protein Z518_03397 [Rhinocladiella mackenziei CBS 650.93]|uniref:FHA domain-containing protein n=1 Tax=Rhinocladiella mackenziei CBS 650.93 TaxID=1442369 RepID=A0A0D2JHA6_9EURO|nr:uncharacterized protein Z518_03397 [Rhinocladiella mackenziei CBS 650.93]KIX08740.1 hypothetical protein Z518_03397 [Rhinocladiella mackenziei CBS 650.93]